MTKEIHSKFKTKEQLTKEIKFLQSRITELEGAQAKYKRLEKALLRKSEERFRQVAQSAGEFIWEVDRNGLYTYASPVVEKILGYKPEEIIGKKYFYDFFLPAVRDKLKKEAFEVFAKKGTFKNFVNPNIHKHGNIVYLKTNGMPVLNDKGNLLGYRGADTDITERRKAEIEKEKLNKELIKSNKRLKQLSLRDIQTGLYNHRYLEEIIEVEFHRARRYVHPMSVIMLDIDYFKSINDVYGHQFGDLVLKQIANQLKRMVRRYDIVIRFGGEEFIIISPGVDRSHALILARRLLDTFNLYNFGNKKHMVKLKLSLAVVSYPEDRITKGMDLINLADQIINRVKEAGGNRTYSSVDIKKKKHRVLDEGKETSDIKLLKVKLDTLGKRAHQSLVEAIFAFAKTIELKDHYTGEHVENTVYYATGIARELGLPKDEIELVRQAAILHDLGKIGISEKILLKKSKLTKKEFEEIKKHPQIAVDILRPIQYLHGIIPFIFYHHERWDGKGYPSGIKGEEIPIGARIIAIADVYQALISQRPYRKAYSKKEAIKIIKNGFGTQFDPHVVNVFLKILQEEKQLSRR